ncbi:MAG: GGDEF domain-containing protein [Actinomycetota bacterium]|nr:GGDEF domain-containing protein [Actinomycetota bacterium]
MQFNVPATRHDLAREAVATGFASQLVCIPVLVSVLLQHDRPVRWWELGAGAGLAVTSLAILVAVIATRPASDYSSISPELSVALTMMPLVGLCFVQLASPHPDLYVPVVVIGALYLALIGDRGMRTTGAVIGVALVAGCAWASHDRGAAFATTVLVGGGAVVAVAWMASHATRSIIMSLGSDEDRARLSSALAGAESFAGGLEAALPLVPGVLATDRVVVVGRDATQDSTRCMAWWEHTGGVETLVLDPPVDEHAPELADPRLAPALDAGEVVVDGDRCIVPIGYDGNLALALVLDHHAVPGESPAAVRAAADVLATSFLRHSARVAFVAGLRHESRTDALTGLANRRTLTERLALELARAGRSGRPLALAMVDLDHFKSSNDAHGHVAGDTVLRTVAAVLASHVRAQDLAARYGGEEFCLLLPETGERGATAVLESLRAAVAATTEGAVTFSAGVAVWDRLEEGRDLVARADAALYRAKQEGRDRVAVHEAAPGH